MITGIGIDIERISRVSRTIEQYGDAFTERMFTDREQGYSRGKGRPYQHFTARFAAKEAFVKAIGTGWRGEFSWTDVEVVNNEQGKPELCLHGGLARHFDQFQIHLSLTHTDDYVVAVVVIEQESTNDA